MDILRGSVREFANVRTFAYVLIVPDIAMSSPFVTELADDFSEIGLRMGVGFTLSGRFSDFVLVNWYKVSQAIGGLIGTPIDGALLTREYVWWRAGIFSGVRDSMQVYSAILLTFLRSWQLQDLFSPWPQYYYPSERRGEKLVMRYVYKDMPLHIISCSSDSFAII